MARRFFLPLIALLVLIPFPSTASAEILLWEDFEDGVADGFVEIDPYWSVLDGAYRCYVYGANTFTLSAAGDGTWSDYSVDCDIRASGSINQVVAFRLQDRHNFYDLNLRADPYNDVVLSKVVGGSDAWNRFAPLPNTIGEWHHLHVSCEGNRIKVGIDGESLFDHYDETNPYLVGGIAVAGYAGGSIPLQIAWYDNVLVEGVAPIATSESSWDHVKSLYR